MIEREQEKPMPPDDFTTGKEALLAVLRRWDAGVDLIEGRDLFEQWLTSVQARGWARGDVYRLVWEILKEDPSEMSQASLDELGEIETALSGFCHENCIVRFPNEPTGTVELAAYVRGNRWR
jgi:hypothetical protein